MTGPTRIGRPAGHRAAVSPARVVGRVRPPQVVFTRRLVVDLMRLAGAECCAVG